MICFIAYFTSALKRFIRSSTFVFDVCSVARNDLVFRTLFKPWYRSLQYDVNKIIDLKTVFLALHSQRSAHSNAVLVDSSFPPEVHEIKRATRLPNSRPFQQISVLNDVYKYSFYPRTILTWNNLPINA